MLAGADGNVSYRISNDEIVITPSGISKARMSEDDFCIINIDGEILHGKPSSERLMHLQIYHSCPSAKAVIHAHPPHAIAWTLANTSMSELPSKSLPEIILAAGKIPFVQYARTGTQAMGDVLIPYLPNQRSFILKNHGAVTWGESLDEALLGMERVEHTAHILYLAKNMGEISELPKEEIQALHEKRKTIGSKLL